MFSNSSLKSGSHFIAVGTSFSFFLLFLILYSAQGQSCLSNGITFRSQSDIDDFASDYPGCTQIEGNVTIQGNPTTPITNLDGLAQLQTINGFLRLYDNAQVASLNGLHNLEHIGGYLYIYNMDGLSSMSGLDNLHSIGQFIYLEHNNGLQSMEGFSNLRSVGSYIYMGYNFNLFDLTALSNLTSINGRLELVYNTALPSLEGLENIGHAGITELVLINANLSFCAVQSICDYLCIPSNNATIFNATGCQDRTEIEAACGGCNTGCGDNPNGLCVLRVSPVIKLQGAYDPANGLMHEHLRTNMLIPLTEPYTGLGYVHVGEGGSEEVDPSIFDISGPDAIVDWVFLELRDKSNATTVIATRSALLQRDGDVVDVDGESPPAFNNVSSDEYYLVVRHRNHLGVMSASPLAFSETATVVDFTSDLDQIFGGVNGTAALADGKFGLYGGDFNRNGQIQNTDYAAMVLTIGASGYQSGDFDLNGQVQNTDLQLNLTPNIGKGEAF